MVERLNPGPELQSLLAAHADCESGPRPQDLTARLRRAEDIRKVVGELSRQGLVLAMLVATDEERTLERDIKVRYVFEPGADIALPRPDVFVTLMVSLDPAHPLVPSVTPSIASANWHEREAHDLFGITFSEHPDPRSLVLHDGWPAGLYPMRKGFDPAMRPPVQAAEEFPHLQVEGEGVFEVPVGPIHAGIIEPGHFRFSTVGEKILHLEPRLFYTHRGLEKRMEGLIPLDAFFVVERICGVCSLSHGLGFCEALEQIAEVQVPKRARALRTLALELERLYNHVGDLGNIPAGAGYHYGTSAGLRMKEPLQQLNECLTGNRFLRGFVTPGGVRLDLTPELARSIEAATTATREALENLMARVENNASVLDRFDTTGVLPGNDAKNLGVTGVAARASGIDRDARIDHPHGWYGDEQGPRVSIATATECDVHARFRLRATEAYESMRLIHEILGALPDGPIATRLPNALRPWGIGISAIESPRGAAIHWLRIDDKGHVDRYHLRSPSYANWPALPLAAQNDIIPDFPLINKSFELCYSCTDR